MTVRFFWRRRITSVVGLLGTSNRPVCQMFGMTDVRYAELLGMSVLPGRRIARYVGSPGMPDCPESRIRRSGAMACGHRCAASWACVFSAMTCRPSFFMLRHRSFPRIRLWRTDQARRQESRFHDASRRECSPHYFLGLKYMTRPLNIWTSAFSFLPRYLQSSLPLDLSPCVLPSGSTTWM